MDSSAIALSVNYFNITATLIMAFFAIYGLIVIFGRNSSLNIFHGRAFMQAFCVASLAAFALEATAFNWHYYLKFFAGPEFHTTGPSPDDQFVILTSDSAVTGKIQIDTVQIDTIKTTFAISFKNLNMDITSVFVDVDFGNNEQVELSISWLDEQSTPVVEKMLYKQLPHENHAAVHPSGKVSELTVAIGSKGTAGLIQVAVNKQIPLYFSGLRLFAVSLLIFAVIVFFRKPLRVRASYYLFEYGFDPANKKQKLIYACTVVLLIVFAFICTHTSISDFFSNHHVGTQYNKYLVDALIAGQWHLDFGELADSERPLSWERPYDRQWRDSQGYDRFSDYVWDAIWYEGKYYAYFSPVPALLVFVPYKLITGNYLGYHSVIFLFATIAIVLMALLWRLLVKKYMPDSRFSFFLLAFLALFFASYLFYPIRHASFYSVARLSGFMFVVAGFLLLFKSIENEGVKPIKLFFACFCLALAVGCRPNLMFMSLLVPVVLWKNRSWKLAALILTPYLMVAVPIWIHNYIHFGSIFETGITYYLSIYNNQTFYLMNPLGKAVRTAHAILCYLFLPTTYSLHFPFVNMIPIRPPAVNIMQVRDYGPGMINFPIVICLLYFFKKIFSKDKPETFHILSAFLIIVAIQLNVISLMGFAAAYMVDMAFCMILPSVFCAYYWCSSNREGEMPRKLRLKAVYVLLAVSIFVGLFMFVGQYIASDPTGANNSDPVLYRYLEYSLGIVRDR